MVSYYYVVTTLAGVLDGHTVCGKYFNVSYHSYHSNHYHIYHMVTYYILYGNNFSWSVGRSHYVRQVI